jgi:hypothetical protein
MWGFESERSREERRQSTFEPWPPAAANSVASGNSKHIAAGKRVGFGEFYEAIFRLISFRRPRGRIDVPHQPHASREVLVQLPLHFTPRVARGKHFDGQVGKRPIGRQKAASIR